MARDRQRSKARQRQQQRRDERLAQRGDSGAAPQPRDPETTESDHQLEHEADLAVGAPLHDLGTSDRTLREDPPEPSFETDDDTLLDEETDDGSRDGSGSAEATAAGGPRGHRWSIGRR